MKSHIIKLNVLLTLCITLWGYGYVSIIRFIGESISTQYQSRT